MNLSQQIAKHTRDVFFGGNWTAVNLKDSLADVNWQMAVKRVDALNTIAALVFHIHYYVAAVLKVLQGGPLDAHDKYSFDLPSIKSEDDWKRLVTKTMEDATLLADEIEKLDEPGLYESLADPKYGNRLRNFLGIIEHTHYHLGQISLLKKMTKEQ
ncbi:MAG TPA: DUF1572 domain-containing protein [Chitinophagaceae bacterium]|nr:DUF1572 domain-containing protein [Chitinophagaceae bacterium]